MKSKYGVPADYTECPREITVCNATLCSNDLIYVPDLTTHERYKHLPIVTEEPHIRFYCGMPLINREGHALGTLCVVGFEPHELRPSQREAVRRLSQQAMALLELRRQLIEALMLSSRSWPGQNLRRAGARDQSDDLLRNISCPEKVAEELKASGHVEPRFHEAITILYSDFKEFTLLTPTPALPPPPDASPGRTRGRVTRRKTVVGRAPRVAATSSNRCPPVRTPLRG